MSSIPIVGRRAERKVDVAELFIGAHDRPDVGVAGVLPGAVLPSLVAVLARLGDRMEHPEFLTGPDIETTHIAGSSLLRRLRVRDRRAHDDDIVHQEGR